MLNYFAIALLVSASLGKELKLVVEFFRHGYRSPEEYIDPQTGRDTVGQNWDIPAGDLTSIGHRQHYLLGQELREKYIKTHSFLSETFKAAEFALYTTEVKRTFDSISSHMSGLFPPGSHKELTQPQADSASPPVSFEGMDQLKAELKLNPTQMNIGTFPANTSFLKEKHINVHNICKGILELDYYNTPVFKDLEQKTFTSKIYDGFFTDIKLEKDFFNEKRRIPQFFDDLDMDIGEQMSFSSKLKENFIDNGNFVQFHETFFSQVWFLSEENYASRVASSSIFRGVLGKMKKRIELNSNEYSSENPKMLVYSGHDSTLTVLQNTLKHAFNAKFTPPFVASNILIEFYKKEDASYSVEILANGSKILEMNHSEFDSTLNKSLVEAEEIDTFCGFNSENLVLPSILVLLLSILI